MTSFFNKTFETLDSLLLAADYTHDDALKKSLQLAKKIVNRSRGLQLIFIHILVVFEKTSEFLFKYTISAQIK